MMSQISPAQTYNISIAIPNLKNTKGEILIGVYNKQDGFPKENKQYKYYIIKADKFSGEYNITDLPRGEYAIAIFHDTNADGICNTNFLGIPKEGYGFSKNIKPVFSVPKFNECKIDLNSNMAIKINLIY